MTNITYISIPKPIENNVANLFWILFIINMYITYEETAITKLAIKGFNTNFVLFNLRFIFLFKILNSMNKAIAWHTTVEKAAPAVPPIINSLGFIGIKYKFKINLKYFRFKPF